MTKNSTPPNFVDQTMWTGDNLEIMRGMNSETVDLIYLDPPFNSNANYAAPIGSKAAGAAFKDTWALSDIEPDGVMHIREKHPALWSYIVSVKEICDKSMMAYLAYIAPRIMEMRRLLKPTGSIYLHCDPYASHYLKAVMDAIFGVENCRNEIIWRIGWVSGYKTQKRGWIRNHETIHYYIKSKAAADLFNKEYIPYPSGYVRRDGKPPTGKGFPMEDTWNCHSGDVLDSIMIKSFSKEKTGYPTQKPLDLLRRIIKASSNPGDMVLDPFCGCATACIAAAGLEREWVGIDLSDVAASQVKKRMRETWPMLYLDLTHRTEPPQRTDLGKLPPYNCDENKQQLYGEQSGYCNGCRKHFELRNMTVDHFIPIKRGGTDHIDNLQLLCGGCNSTKGARTQEYLWSRLKEEGMINDEDIKAMSKASQH